MVEFIKYSVFSSKFVSVRENVLLIQSNHHSFFAVSSLQALRLLCGWHWASHSLLLGGDQAALLRVFANLQRWPIGYPPPLAKSTTSSACSQGISQSRTPACLCSFNLSFRRLDFWSLGFCSQGLFLSFNVSFCSLGFELL